MTRYHLSHPEVRTRLAVRDVHRLEALLRERGVTLAEWLRDAIARDESDRPSEAEQKVRMVVPEWVARVGEQAMATQAEILLRLAEQHRRDLPLAHAYRQAAKPWLDAEGFFHEVLRRYAGLRPTRVAREPPTTPQTDPPTASRHTGSG